MGHTVPRRAEPAGGGIVMQDKVLLALRGRLRRRGYRYIHIRRTREDGRVVPDWYTVTAVEPLSGTIVTSTKPLICYDTMMR